MLQFDFQICVPNLLFLICAIIPRLAEANPQQHLGNGYFNPRHRWMKPHTPNYGYSPYFPPSPPPPPPPFRRRYNYPRRPNYYPNFPPPYYNRKDNENVVWSSQWTRWLPASKVNWDNLHNKQYKRTFILDIPPSFSGHISNGDVKRFKGLVNKYFSGIFPVVLKHQKGEGSKSGGRPRYDINDDEKYEEVEEFIPSCDELCCYRECRLSLVGGGKCTKAGCVCYESFFSPESGEPNMLVREDQLWYKLSYTEHEQILNATKKNHPQYMCEKDMLKGESKIDSNLAKIYEGLVDFEHRSDLNLTLYLLHKKYGKTIDDLVELRINEIKARPRLISRYRSRWWHDYTYLSFDEFLNKTVTEEEDLTTADSIAYFFEKRRAKYGIDISDDLIELHKHAHGIEVRILEQLNVIEDDYCCEEEQPSEEWITTRPPYDNDDTTRPTAWSSSWDKPTTSRPSWPKVTKGTVTTITASLSSSTTTTPPLSQPGDTTSPTVVTGSGDSEGSSGDREEEEEGGEEDSVFDYDDPL